jgi:hypothetical protein
MMCERLKAGAAQAHALFGPPPEIIAGLQALQAVGVRYVLISGGEAKAEHAAFRRRGGAGVPKGQLTWSRSGGSLVAETTTSVDGSDID